MSIGEISTKDERFWYALYTRARCENNIRELQNIIQRTVLLYNASEILPEHLPAEVQNHSESAQKLELLSFREARKLFEQTYFENILTRSKGVIREAARLADMDYKNFYMKLKSHNINPNAFKIYSES